MKCPVCGETAPEPAWFCIPRQIGEAVQDKPCTYSVEGHARFVKRTNEKFATINQEIEPKAQ